VPACVTKPVHDTKTVEVCRMVPKQVADTVTRCVPKVVYRAVPCEPTCALPGFPLAHRGGDAPVPTSNPHLGGATGQRDRAEARHRSHACAWRPRGRLGRPARRVPAIHEPTRSARRAAQAEARLKATATRAEPAAYHSGIEP